MFTIFILLIAIVIAIAIFVFSKGPSGDVADEPSQPLQRHGVENGAEWPEDLDLIPTLGVFIEEKKLRHGAKSLTDFEAEARVLITFYLGFVSDREHSGQILQDMGHRNGQKIILASLVTLNLEDLIEPIDAFLDFHNLDVQKDTYFKDATDALEGRLIDRTTRTNGIQELKDLNARNRFTHALTHYFATNHQWKNAPDDPTAQIPPLVQNDAANCSEIKYVARPNAPPLLRSVISAAYANLSLNGQEQLNEADITAIRFYQVIAGLGADGLRWFFETIHDDVFASRTIKILNESDAPDIATLIEAFGKAFAKYETNQMPRVEFEELEVMIEAKLKELDAITRLEIAADRYLDQNYPWK